MTPDQPTVFQAVSETVARASELVQLEIRLAKAELAEKSVHLKAGLATILVGWVLIIVALLLLAQSLVLLLIGFGLSTLGATPDRCRRLRLRRNCAGRRCRKELDARALTPYRTLDNFERDRALVKEKLS